jgi:hypothetical protein
MKFVFCACEYRRVPLADNGADGLIVCRWIKRSLRQVQLQYLSTAPFQSSPTGWVFCPMNVVNEEFVIVEIVAELSMLVGQCTMQNVRLARLCLVLSACLICFAAVNLSRLDIPHSIDDAISSNTNVGAAKKFNRVFVVPDEHSRSVGYSALPCEEQGK